MRMSDTRTIWLLSAYRADSHASWADWLQGNLPDINWQVLELPGRHFRWRIRGNPISWLHALPKQNPDLILATSMVDLSTLKGLHPRLAGVPSIYYFHENQFAYPLSENQLKSVDPKMVQLYGALAADRLLFNSGFNRDSFLQGIDELLTQLPDQVPAGITDSLRDKSSVLPVAVEPVNLFSNTAEQKDPRLILWNHRWEYDKAPEIFAEALSILQQTGMDFRLALLGARARVAPEALEQIEQTCADNIIVSKKVDREQYCRIVSQASIVVSTAIHEFQGLSIQEAVSAGAVPLVPDALCYPEQYDQQYRYPAGDSKQLAARMADFLHNRPPAPDVSMYLGGSLIDKWCEVLAV
jgi:glycosyltransferase involved in cell wall biosynthesis